MLLSKYIKWKWSNHTHHKAELSAWIKTKASIFCQQEIHFKHKDINILRIYVWETIQDVFIGQGEEIILCD